MTKYTLSVGTCVLVILVAAYLLARDNTDPTKFSTWPAELQKCIDKPLGTGLWCLTERVKTERFGDYKKTFMAEWRKRHG